MENDRRASLVVLGGPNGGMTIPLSERPVTLGRTWGSDILVDESTVSRRHALIMETSAGFILRDLNSTNGTFVGHDKMGQTERPLNPNPPKEGVGLAS